MSHQSPGYYWTPSRHYYSSITGSYVSPPVQAVSDVPSHDALLEKWDASWFGTQSDSIPEDTCISTSTPDQQLERYTSLPLDGHSYFSASQLNSLGGSPSDPLRTALGDASDVPALQPPPILRGAPPSNTHARAEDSVNRTSPATESPETVNSGPRAALHTKSISLPTDPSRAVASQQNQATAQGVEQASPAEHLKQDFQSGSSQNTSDVITSTTDALADGVSGLAIHSPHKSAQDTNDKASILGTWVNRQYRLLEQTVDAVDHRLPKVPSATGSSVTSGSIAYAASARGSGALLPSSGSSGPAGVQIGSGSQGTLPDVSTLQQPGIAGSRQGSASSAMNVDASHGTAQSSQGAASTAVSRQAQPTQGPVNIILWPPTGVTSTDGVARDNLAQPRQSQQIELEPRESQCGDLVGRVSESGSDVAAAAAWRWRFARRWQTEQARAAAAGPDEVGSCNDKAEEALAYLQAGGGAGWNMQVAVARTQSLDMSALHSAGTHGQGSLLAGDLLLDDGSYTTTGSLARTTMLRRGVAEDSATRHVNSINRRAVHLLQQQAELEQQAEQRWMSAMNKDGTNATWVGHYLQTVEIDDWGTFRFLVVRVRGRDNKQRILIRGRNYCSEGQITEDLNRKVSQICSTHSCPAEPLDVMGGGVMEWRRERDRHLHLHSAWATLPSSVAGGGGGGANGAAGGPGSGQEILNLAAVLTKQHLPVHFKVSIEGS